MCLQCYNSHYTADVRVGGSPTPTGRLIFPFIRSQGFTIRGEADQIGQEGVETFQIPLEVTGPESNVFAAPPAVVEITDRTGRQHHYIGILTLRSLYMYIPFQVPAHHTSYIPLSATWLWSAYKTE